MFSSLLLFLVVFIVLSLTRTKIDGEVSHRKTESEARKLVNIFFAITGTIIAIALILVIVSFTFTQETELSLYATALLFAVIISLVSRGTPGELHRP